jgi:hypothetical protein
MLALDWTESPGSVCHWEDAEDGWLVVASGLRLGHNMKYLFLRA